MKKQITIQEWQRLNKEDQLKYSRDCWNPRVYNLRGTAEQYLREQRKVKRDNKRDTSERIDVYLW